MVSAVIVTKNEEQNIIDCIQSLDFCSEIVIIDDFSEDRTLDLVRHLKRDNIKIIQHELKDFSKQRNFALSQVSQKWTLFIDADERISDELQVEILRAVEQEQHIAFSFKRYDSMWGETLQYGEVGSIRLIRLARTDIGKQKWKGMVHETWDIAGPIGEFIHPILHYPHQTIREFLEEIDRYSSLRAEELYKDKKISNVFQIIAYPIGKFLQNYVYRRGYKDGIPGFIIAVMMSLHSFLVRGKLFMLCNSKRT